MLNREVKVKRHRSGSLSVNNSVVSIKLDNQDKMIVAMITYKILPQYYKSDSL